MRRGSSVCSRGIPKPVLGEVLRSLQQVTALLSLGLAGETQVLVECRQVLRVGGREYVNLPELLFRSFSKKRRAGHGC